ncbi:hypothetical protein [Roseibium sp. MMSF_3412]|uniref:hypothetical protein n=1 Tax=Roseibium sp. MMSF_3412 TaxID=3046712 RepID=UPI00273DB708|nr:hypothetical protein [Roseibium sp. MMSF_3412]
MLFVLFILGTTSYTVSDLLSGLQVDSPIVKFQLQSAQNVGGSSDRNPQAQGAIDFPKEAAENSDRGLQPAPMLRFMSWQVDRDRTYLEHHTKNFRAKYKDTCLPEPTDEDYCEVASDKYGLITQNLLDLGKVARSVEYIFLEYIGCLSASKAILEDEHYFDRAFSEIIPSIREFYWSSAKQTSLEEASDGTGISSNRNSSRALEVALAKAIEPVASHVINVADNIGKRKELLEGDQLKRYDDSVVQALEQAKSCKSVVERMVKLPATENEPEKQRYDLRGSTEQVSINRPYLAIAYALALAHVNDFETGITTLDRWIRVELGDEAALSDFDVDDIRFWYLLRVRSIQIALYKEWRLRSRYRTLQRPIRREAFNQLIVLLDITRKQMREIPAVEGRARYFPKPQYDGVPGRTLEAVGFLRQPPFRGCGAIQNSAESELEGADGRLISVYYHVLYVSGLYGTEHEKYDSTRSAIVNETLTEIANTDFSCMSLPERESQIFRAEVFRAYALARIQEIKLRRNFDEAYAEWLKTKLEIALQAFKVSRNIIHDQAEDDEKLRLSSNELKVRLRVSHSEWLLKDLNEWIDRVELLRQQNQ